MFTLIYPQIMQILFSFQTLFVSNGG